MPIINIYNKQIAQPNKGKKLKNYLRNNRNFLLFLLLFGIFRTAVADVVFVNRVAFDLKVPLTDRILAHIGEPQRGDIVTFSSPKDGTRLIKRIAAVPGDMIAMRGKKLIVNGREASYEPTATVTEDVNGTPLQALRMTERSGAQTHTIQWLPQIAARDNFGPVQIPPDQFLMLGDNRDDSADSRYIGLVPRKMLIGRAVRILVSADIKGNWAPRFERFGQKLE